MSSAAAFPPRPSASPQSPANENILGTATPTATTHEQKDCPLFRLAPELRNKIYEYTLFESQPAKRTTTRLPITKTFELIDLDDAQDLRPSNALLATCRVIHSEARGIFVTAQRAFWASNNFLINLKSDWEGAITTKPSTTITHLHYEYFNLIPMVVIAVPESQMGEFHFISAHVQYGWGQETYSPKEDPELNTAHKIRQARFEVHKIDIVLGKSMSDFINALLSKLGMRELDAYGKSAEAYVRSTAINRRAFSRLELSLLGQVRRFVERQRGSLKRGLAETKMAVLNAVLQHLCDLHHVQRRPQGKSR